MSNNKPIPSDKHLSTTDLEKILINNCFKFTNPFKNLYEMVDYFYSIATSKNTEQLEVFADYKFAQNKERYPILENFYDTGKEVFLLFAYLESIQPKPDDPWMKFNEKELNHLLCDPFFQEYNDTICYDGKDVSLIKNYSNLLKGHRKYPFLEIYTLMKLQSIAICNLPNTSLTMIWYEWFYKDYILEYIWNLWWYNIIADVYIKKGKNWFYDTAMYYPTLGLDACMYKWACLGITACHKTKRLESKALKKDLTDLYSELLIASVRSGSLEKNQMFLNYIQEEIANFDDVEIDQLQKKMESLKHENQKLLNDKATMEKTMDTLRKEIAKLETDTTRTDDEKVESIARRIYAMMPDETSQLNKSNHNFSEIWDKLSDETKQDINRSVRFFQDMESVDVALFLMIRNVEREFARHFFDPFQESSSFKKMGISICSNHQFVKTHDALKDTKNHPTMGNIPFIGKALKSKVALQSSTVISAFAKFLGKSTDNFCDICQSIESYRVGLSKKRIVDIRNIFAHGNTDKNKAYDKSSYIDVARFLYEPPLQILFRLVINSKRP